MKRLGVVEFAVEALHEGENIFFDFIEENFKVVEVDHSNYETQGIIRMILEDISDKFLFLPTQGQPLRYTFLGSRQEENTITFKVLLNEPQTSTN